MSAFPPIRFPVPCPGRSRNSRSSYPSCNWGVCTLPYAYLVLITCFRPQPRLFTIDICAPSFPNIYAPCLLHRLSCPPILALSSPVSRLPVSNYDISADTTAYPTSPTCGHYDEHLILNTDSARNTPFDNHTACMDPDHQQKYSSNDAHLSPTRDAETLSAGSTARNESTARTMDVHNGLEKDFSHPNGEIPKITLATA